MYEKVNPKHPDKIADRIAGAIVDKAYEIEDNPKIAVEVIIGHNVACIISETSVKIGKDFITSIVNRIAGEGIEVKYVEVEQDKHLAENQSKEIRCGDNGIFKGVPITKEQKKLKVIAQEIYEKYQSDGKYIIDKDNLIICQSKADSEILSSLYEGSVVNPLGDWDGGVNTDTGATNRKLGSDMGDAVTGGGLHGKDLSKADVSINIFCHLIAQKTHKTITASCAIGDKYVLTSIGKIRYKDIVEIAKSYIQKQGGFEKFAEWGLI